MKKTVIILLAASLLLCTGCTGPSKTEPSPSPIVIETPEPTPTPTPEPASVPGTIRANGVAPLYKYLSRGDAVMLSGALSDYYTVSVDDVLMLIEKRFIRMESETAPAEHKGYAQDGAAIYDSAYLTGEPLATLTLNDELQVLDEFEGVSFVKFGEISGYMESAKINENKIEYYAGGGGGGSDYSGGYSGGGGGSTGGGGGSAGGGGGSTGGGSDGGEITLGAHGGNSGELVLLSSVSETWENKALKPVSATILTDKLPVYLCQFNRGDAVKVTSQEGEEWSILFAGKIVKLPSYLISLDSAAPYEAWNGFAVSGAQFYSSYLLSGEVTALEANTGIRVIDDLGSCYVVEVDGVLGYMPHDHISESEVQIYNYSGGDSSGGGGGSVGGGGSTGGGGGADWTEPVM